MRPQSARAKGRRLQQQIAKDLLELFPSLEEGDFMSAPGGLNGEDVICSPAARKLFPYQVECKNKATSQIHTYMEQAKSHGKHEPRVLVKMDRKEILAIVSWEHFQKLITMTKE